MPQVLGIDLGPNSIGWALINEEKNQIIDTGVRIFQEGVNPPQGKEESKNKARRDARGARRRNFRYKMRRNTLIKALKKLGMFPDDPYAVQDYFKMDPYLLRKRGLDEKLTLVELGRALYHLDQRRGFLSNRKAGGNEDSAIFKGDQVKAGINEVKIILEENKYRTFGEYLASLDPHDKRRRNRYTLRLWYKEEFEKLWTKQQEFYPEQLNDQEKAFIYKLIFMQRPLRSQKHLVGFCTFEKDKRCAPKSSPVFQYFRVLEQVNRLRIGTTERKNEPLNDEERKTLIDYLNVNSKLEFKKMLKLLHLPEDTIINLDTEKLLGNHTYSELVKIFGIDRFTQMTDEKRYEIWHTIHFATHNEWLEKYGREQWGLDDEGIKSLLGNTIENKPNDGYARLSRKAIMKIIPNLEKGARYDEAALAAGYHHSIVDEVKPVEFLPDPNNIRNPIVQQALYQLKKLINAILLNYERPDIIRVELARELKASKDQRTEIRIQNIQRQKEAENIRARLIRDNYVQDPKRDDVIKYLLWQECGETDPYSGKKISLTDLYKDPKFEIEHILPYSRSLDDSFANKTLCSIEYNRQKGNRTPWEAFGHSNDYELMLERVRKFKSEKAFSKLRKFQVKDLAAELEDEFINRQLNDTAYISREARKYLQQITPRVDIVKGGATAKLRTLWGMNSILSGDENVKTRADHRHHAVDALVVAQTTLGMLHKLSSYHKYNNPNYAKKDLFAKPWDSFREEAETAVNSILVSYHFRNRARGKLHEETNYGQITDPESGEKVYVVRKSIESITAKMIGNIVNPETRKLVYQRLRQCGVNTQQKKWDIPKQAFAEPLLHPKTGHPIKSVRVKIPAGNMIPLYGEKRKLFVEPGGNHHIEIFANSDYSKKTGYVISLYEAVKRKKAGLPVIDKRPRDTEYPNFVMSLAINEMFLVDVKEEDIDWNNPDQKMLAQNLYRVQKLEIQKHITLRHHTVSLSGSTDPGVISKMPNTINGIKVVINYLGKLGKADA